MSVRCVVPARPPWPTVFVWQGCILASHSKCTKSGLRGCFFRIALLTGLLRPSSIAVQLFENFVPSFP